MAVMKLTDKMLKLQITDVPYIGDDLSMDGGSRRKFAALQRKIKWKFVSEVLFERGYHVSPQLSEDKFNDLNKRFKKLNENRFNMHHDLALQHSVKLAFRNIDDQENDDFRNHQLERRTNRKKKTTSNI